MSILSALSIGRANLHNVNTLTFAQMCGSFLPVEMDVAGALYRNAPKAQRMRRGFKNKTERQLPVSFWRCPARRFVMQKADWKPALRSCRVRKFHLEFFARPTKKSVFFEMANRVFAFIAIKCQGTP
jgi:hypothetical protein